MQPNPISQPTTIQPHLSIDELEVRYQRAKTPAERSQLQIVWLIAQGKSTEETASITGYNSNWVSQLICRYNQLGPQQFVDKQPNNLASFFTRLITQVNTLSIINEDFGQEEFFPSGLEVNSAYLTFF